MAEEIVKTIENVDKLFSEIVVNGQSHKSQRYVSSQSSSASGARANRAVSGETVQGEDVHGVDLNRTLHNFSDPRIDFALETETAERKLSDNILQSNIDAEEQARTQADTQLQNSLNNEIIARGDADASLQADISAEATARQNADNSLQADLTAETNARTSADTAVQQALDLINSKIPAQASAQNQLADKSFVNSSIATNTATFLGTYTSMAQIEAIPNPTNNDYVSLEETDQLGNTSYSRYKYSAETESWLFEYAINNSGFTAEQWETINSGLTASSVTDAINALDVAQAGGNGKYIKAISETDGKISATEGTIDSTVTAGSSNPVSSDAVATAIADEASARSIAIGAEATERNNAIANAVGALDVAQAGGNGKYIKAISETDGKINATEGTIDSAVTAGSDNPVTGDAVATAVADEASARATAVSNEATARATAITNAINALDATSVGGSGKYIESISQTNGVISAVEKTMPSAVTVVNTVQTGNMSAVTSNAVALAIAGISITNADTVDGFHASQSNSASTCVVRDINGQIFTGNVIGAFFNSNIPNENPASYSNPAIMFTSDDKWIRRADPSLISVGYATSAGSATSAGYATSAGSATSATNASYATSAGSAGSSNCLSFVGFGNGCLTAYQTDGNFAGRTGWATYIVGNHGDGATYFHQILALPFWDSPQYQRRTDAGDQGWHNFLTDENWTAYPAYKIRVGAPSTPADGDIWIG